MSGKKKTRLLAFSALLLVVFTFVFSWQYYSKNNVKAAAGVITINDDASNGTYYLRKKNIPAFVENIQTGTNVKWTTSDTGVFRINNSTNSDVTTTGGTITLNAYGIGTATLTAEFTDGANVSQVLTRIINVPSAISENAEFFELLRADGVETAMVLDLTERSQGTLSLLYDVSPGTNIKWTTGNPYVVSMDASGYLESNTSGFFRATGTGKTTITVSYAEEGKLVTSSVNVYVGPKITVANQDSSKIYVKRKDLVDVGANTLNNNATISDKVSWTLTSQSGQILETSATANKKYFSSSPYSSQLEVTGKAGFYYLYVFTAGTFTENDNLLNNTINGRLKKTVEVHILPTPFSKTEPESLQVGDSYDVAEMFNMTVEDFNKYFDYSCNPADNGTFANGLFTATKKGSAVLTINYKNGMEGQFSDFLHDTPQFPYQIAVNIYHGFTLDRSEASIYVGGKLTLNTVYGENKGIIKWSSSDPSSVSVVGADTSAVITGVKTTGDKFVVITASMTLNDGRTLTATCNVRVGTTATSITLNETNLSLRVGATSTISAKFQPATTTSVPLEWLLTDPTVVDITKNSDKSVIVTGKKPGTTILTAVNTDNYITAYCTIRVSQAIESISLNYTQKTMTMSQENLKLRATYLPTTATLTDLVWSTSDPTIATVDDGLVTFKAPGSVWITVQPEWNEYLTMAQCYLTIVASPTAFALDKTTLAMEVGGKETIKPILTAANSTTTIKWKSMDTAIASVSEGVVTAVGVGVTHIVATTAEGLVANCQISVTQKASGIALSTYNLKLAVSEKVKVTATPNPISSTEKTFLWTSRDPNIANVTQEGEVTGVSSGSTIILVKTKSGDIAYLYVNVYDKAKSMTLNYSDKQLAKGASVTLKPIFVPTNVTNTKVTWKSLNPTIATVSDKGKVTAVKGGAAVITCLSDDGGYLATCLITVVEPVTSIKLNQTSYRLGVGKTITLKADITSNSSSNAKVKWSSSNSKIASVTSTGKVTGKRVGECTITAKATDGTGKKAVCKIKVVRQATSLSMSKSVLTVMVNKTAKLTATVKPSNATYKTVNWSSSNKEVAIVDSKGNVTGISVGSCSIKAQAKDNGKKAVTCYVNVVNPVPTSSIIVSAKDLVMIKGQSQMLSYTVTPANHTDKITFASDNKAVATITSTGKIYARRTGSATISITSSSGKQSTVKVTVIGLNKTVLNLEQYDTETLQVDGVATNQITWYSANPSIATCVGGKVVGRKGGSTYVYARVNGIILSCRVNVKAIRR